MAADRNPNDRQSARRAVALNVSVENQVLAEISDQFHCSTSGNLIVKLQGDSTAVTLAVIVGVVYDLRVKEVVKTDTTATGNFLYKTLA